MTFDRIKYKLINFRENVIPLIWGSNLNKCGQKLQTYTGNPLLEVNVTNG